MTSGCAFLHTKTVNTPFMWQIIITHYVSIVNGPNFDSFITQSLVVCRLASPTIRRVTCSTVRQLNLQFSIHCTLFVTHSSPKLRNCNIKSHEWCVRYYLLLLFIRYYYTYKYINIIYTQISSAAHDIHVRRVLRQISFVAKVRQNRINMSIYDRAAVFINKIRTWWFRFMAEPKTQTKIV